MRTINIVVAMLNKTSQSITNMKFTSTNKRETMKLHSLIMRTPAIEENILQEMIDLVRVDPSCLSKKNEEGQLPIQKAVWLPIRVHCIHLLAKEGIKYNYRTGEFGRGTRGGLLAEDPTAKTKVKPNVLQLLVSMVFEECAKGTEETTRISNSLAERAYLGAIIKLRESNLFLKQDIVDHGLLFYASHPLCGRLRHDYLTRWDPDALLTSRYKGLPIIHAIIHRRNIESFSMFFRASFHYHPTKLGLLFQQDDDGQLACKRAFDKYGKDETFQVISKYIKFDNDEINDYGDYPSASVKRILHIVAKEAPQFMSDFAIRYPNAMSERDENGRTLFQTELGAGGKTFKEEGLHFLRMTDIQRRARDPVTGFYPFVMVAVESKSDVSAVFYLLRSSPDLLHMKTLG